MNTFKIIFSDGDFFYTGFNGSLADAKTYYLDHIFNLGSESDNMKKCVEVEEVTE